MATEQPSTSSTQVSTTNDPPQMIVERVFDAPRELVFKAWSDPEHLAQWFGPKGWTLPVCRVDFRPGGVWQYCMRGPGGEESWGRAVYREIVPPERIVYTDSFADAEGNPVEGMPEMVITVEFHEQDGKTRLASRTTFASAEELKKVMDMGVVEGMTQMLDRLEEHLRRYR